MQYTSICRDNINTFNSQYGMGYWSIVVETLVWGWEFQRPSADINPLAAGMQEWGAGKAGAAVGNREVENSGYSPTSMKAFRYFITVRSPAFSI